MSFVQKFAKPLSTAVMTGFLFMSIYLPAVHAQVVSTDALLRAERMTQERAAVAAALERAEVRDVLLSHGVDVSNVQARVANLSADEIHTLAQNIEELPVAGSSDPLGILLFVFVLLLITDIMGLTNVFPFVKHPKRS